MKIKITAFKNFNLTILSLAFGFLFFGFNAAEQHFTPYYQAIGKVDLAFQSLAILYIAIIAGNFVGPATVKKLGIKLSFILGFISYVALVFAIITKSATFIYIFSFVLGAGAGIIGIAKFDFLRFIAPKENRGEFTGAIESVRTFGGFIGIISVSLMLRVLNIDQTFMLLGLVMLIGVGLLLFLTNIKDKEPVALESQNFKLMLKLAITPKVLLLLPFNLSGGFLLGIVLGAIPTIITKNFGIESVGFITSIFHLTLALVSLGAGYFSDIKGRFIFIYGSLVVSILAVVVFLNFTSIPAVIIVMVLLGLGGSLGIGAFSALILDTFEEKIKEASAVLGNLGLVLGIAPAFLLPQFLSQSQLFIMAIFLSILGIATLGIFQFRYSSTSE